MMRPVAVLSKEPVDGAYVRSRSPENVIVPEVDGGAGVEGAAGEVVDCRGVADDVAGVPDDRAVVDQRPRKGDSAADEEGAAGEDLRAAGSRHLAGGPGEWGVDDEVAGAGDGAAA